MLASSRSDRYLRSLEMLVQPGHGRWRLVQQLEAQRHQSALQVLQNLLPFSYHLRAGLVRAAAAVDR